MLRANINAVQKVASTKHTEFALGLHAWELTLISKIRKSMPTKKQPTMKNKHRKAGQRNTPSQTRSCPKDWIVVADHRQAHIYQKTPKGIERVPDECLPCLMPPPRNEATDTAFLEDFACWLDEAESKQCFDRLAIIASPRARDTLQELMGEDAKARIRGTVAKDVEEITADEIEDHLTEVVWL